MSCNCAAKPPVYWVRALAKVLKCQASPYPAVESALLMFCDPTSELSESDPPRVMPHAKCPDGCDPEVCEYVWSWYNELWVLCNGNVACEAMIFVYYQHALQIQCGQS